MLDKKMSVCKTVAVVAREQNLQAGEVRGMLHTSVQHVRNSWTSFK